MAELPRFDRSFFEGPETFTLIGSGHLGGKASGLLDAHRALAERPDGLRPAELEIEVPTLAVVGTDVFDAFLDQNGLRGRDWSQDSTTATSRRPSSRPTCRRRQRRPVGAGAAGPPAAGGALARACWRTRSSTRSPASTPPR